MHLCFIYVCLRIGLNYQVMGSPSFGVPIQSLLLFHNAAHGVYDGMTLLDLSVNKGLGSSKSQFKMPCQ